MEGQLEHIGLQVAEETCHSRMTVSTRVLGIERVGAMMSECVGV